ncbi:hypothetical protein LMIY3S_05773 [Labrys miyagiensis]
MNTRIIVGLGLSLALTSPTLATMPATPIAGGSDVITIAGGCGPGWHRGPYGGCQRNYYYAPRAYYAPRVVVVRPRPYWHHCWRGYYGHLHCN